MLAHVDRRQADWQRVPSVLPGGGRGYADEPRRVRRQPLRVRRSLLIWRALLAKPSHLLKRGVVLLPRRLPLRPHLCLFSHGDRLGPQTLIALRVSKPESSAPNNEDQARLRCVVPQ